MEDQWKILNTNFVDDNGIIRRKDNSYIPTKEEFGAIDILCDEWDYMWEGIQKI